MKINEVAIKKKTTGFKTTGFEDLHRSSPEAGRLIERFIRKNALPLHENYLRQATLLTEHYAYNPKSGMVLLEYRDADGKEVSTDSDSKLDIDAPIANPEEKAKAVINDLLNSVAKISKSEKGFNLDKIVSFLKDKGYDKNKIAQALKSANLDIRDISFSGKGDPNAAMDTLKKYASQLKQAKDAGNEREVKQIAQDMLNLAKDHGDPKLDAAVKSALKRFQASTKDSHKQLNKSNKDAKLLSKQQAHFKAGQKADPEKMAARKAELKAKHKPTESLIRDLHQAIMEAYSRNKQRMLTESTLMERDITQNQLITIIRSVSDHDLATQTAATDGSSDIRGTLQSLPNNVKSHIKQNRQEADRELDNLANSSEAHKLAQKLEDDPAASEAALKASMKAIAELEQENPAAQGTLQKLKAFISKNKGKAAMAAGIIGLLGFAAATGGVGALAPMAAAMTKGGLMGAGGRGIWSGIKGAIGGWKSDQKGILSKMKSSMTGAGKQVAADKGKIATSALAGALIGGGLHQWATGFGGGPDATPDATAQADTPTRHSDMGDIETDPLDQGQGGEEVDVDDNSASDQWSPSQGGEVDYTVAQGDTLSDLAQQNKTTVADILDANPDITNANQINVGQEIKIPQNTIETGESVYKGLSTEEMADMNMKDTGEVAADEVSRDFINNDPSIRTA